MSISTNAKEVSIVAETNKIKIIHYIICASFCLFFRFVPGFAGITPLGMGILVM